MRIGDCTASAQPVAAAIAARREEELEEERSSSMHQRVCWCAAAGAGAHRWSVKSERAGDCSKLIIRGDDGGIVWGRKCGAGVGVQVLTGAWPIWWLRAGMHLRAPGPVYIASAVFFADGSRA
jgi:hypothetical protein